MSVQDDLMNALSQPVAAGIAPIFQQTPAVADGQVHAVDITVGSNPGTPSSFYYVLYSAVTAPPDGWGAWAVTARGNQDLNNVLWFTTNDADPLSDTRLQRAKAATFPLT